MYLASLSKQRIKVYCKILVCNLQNMPPHVLLSKATYIYLQHHYECQWIFYPTETYIKHFRLFWALKSHSLCSCDFRAQNRLDFQQNPSNAPRNVNPPHKNYKAPRHIINSVINSYKGPRFFHHIASTDFKFVGKFVDQSEIDSPVNMSPGSRSERLS